MIAHRDRPEDDSRTEQHDGDDRDGVDRTTLVSHAEPMQFGRRLFSLATCCREVLLALFAPTMPSPDEGGVARDDAADSGAHSEDGSPVSHADIVRLTRAEWMLLLCTLILGTLSVGGAIALILHMIFTGHQ